MIDVLLDLFLVMCLVAFINHVIKWRQGRRSFWCKSDNKYDDRIVPFIPGLGPMFDCEEEREQLERIYRNEGL